MTLVNKLVVGLISSLFIVTAVASVAVNAAPSFDLSIPINTVIRGDVGSMHELASEDVDSQYQGFVCDVKAVAKNQGSVHPGNDLIVASNGTSVTLADVERAAHVETIADGQLTLGDDITVTLKLGQDKVFSGGMNVVVECEEPEPEPIEVCRDGEVIEILPKERLETDTNPPCPEDPQPIEVCRDGVVISINPDELRDTDTNAPCPEVLPETGAGAAIAGLFGLGSAATAGRQWLRSRKALDDTLTN